MLQSNLVFAAVDGVGARSSRISKKARHRAPRSSISNHAPSSIEAEKRFYHSPSTIPGPYPAGSAQQNNTALLCGPGPRQLHPHHCPYLQVGQTGRRSPQLAPTVRRLKLVWERWRERAKGAGLKVVAVIPVGFHTDLVGAQLAGWKPAADRCVWVEEQKSLTISEAQFSVVLRY